MNTYEIDREMGQIREDLKLCREERKRLLKEIRHGMIRLDVLREQKRRASGGKK